MGTTTFYLKNNDFGRPLSAMTKKDLNALGSRSPYSKDPYYAGWKVSMELHNGNVYNLVFWKGRLMKLEDAPKLLTRKYYDKYAGKTLREYEWTILKRLILSRVEYLDKEFKNARRRKKHE